MNLRLEKVRKNQGLSKKEFALKLDITEQAYQNYSNGKRIIPTDVALKAKQLFCISLDWLLSGENKEININYKEELLKTIENLKNEDLKSVYHFAKSKEV